MRLEKGGNGSKCGWNNSETIMALTTNRRQHSYDFLNSKQWNLCFIFYTTIFAPINRFSVQTEHYYQRMYFSNQKNFFSNQNSKIENNQIEVCDEQWF